mgnify:CR=1 FL=1
MLQEKRIHTTNRGWGVEEVLEKTNDYNKWMETNKPPRIPPAAGGGGAVGPPLGGGTT